ncbi:hypothetical protein A3I48_02440 [Candidatus Daviesbacteria bacterium RIFCSPLOWO2_02_FULL_36_7]|uniref:Inositol monophosphatase n=1 Tax=Candidatus Daviesbacteria bacterium RIFCSPLOWO2_02_FULL_36_7 TaxID=1797792 RepID=A0A1F5MIA7_9BACT|nr:MAG: hypothetical protein A3I48_02440 [Candidatus Daviesbacteria bacterium RIFCSPLOWO2_02_FULL_36_7]
MNNSDFTLVLDVVYEAGQRLKKYFGNIEAKSYKTSFAADAVTRLDEETERFLEEELKKIDPSIGFTGEEFGTIRKSDRFWLVDPIDGTGLFIRGIWGCTIMLALVENDELIFSIIYDFILNNMYTAEKQEGASLNGLSIHVSNRHLKDAFIYVESDLQKERNRSIYSQLDKVCVVLASYPAGIHFALTAEGKIEGRIGFDPYGKNYDFAPGQLLVKEAGGVVANIGTATFDYKNLNFLAVNKEVYETLTVGKDAIFPIFPRTK